MSSVQIPDTLEFYPGLSTVSTVYIRTYIQTHLYGYLGVWRSHSTDLPSVMFFPQSS